MILKGNFIIYVRSVYKLLFVLSSINRVIYKRINDCFERSINGKGLDTASLEMHAIYLYMRWHGKDVAKGKQPSGAELEKLPYLDRSAEIMGMITKGNKQLIEFKPG